MTLAALLEWVGGIIFLPTSLQIRTVLIRRKNTEKELNLEMLPIKKYSKNQFLSKKSKYINTVVQTGRGGLGVEGLLHWRHDSALAVRITLEACL